MTTAATKNRAIYDELWADFSPFIRYNPGARHRRRLLFELLDGVRFDTVLDIGCGNAELLRLIRQRFPATRRLVGADISGAVVEQNARKHPDMQFHVLDIQERALPERFDLVTACEVIEHLDDRRTAFRHLGEMVAPGGHLAITAPTGKVYATEKHFGHTTHPTIDEVRALGDDAGFELLRAWNWGFPMYSLTKWATNVNPEWALKNFGGTDYGLPQILVSDALYWANRVLNAKTSPLGVQLFALYRRR